MNNLRNRRQNPLTPFYKAKPNTATGATIGAVVLGVLGAIVAGPAGAFIGGSIGGGFGAYYGAKEDRKNASQQ